MSRIYLETPQGRRLSMIAAIAKAETEMYLRVAAGFAEQGDEVMTATVFDWAALALNGKCILLRDLNHGTERK